LVVTWLSRLEGGLVVMPNERENVCLSRPRASANGAARILPIRSKSRLIRIVVCIVSLCALALVARRVGAAGAVTLYVDDGSTCTSGCGSQSAPYRQIQGAIDDADNQIIAGTISGATVRVAAGLYPERIYIVPNIHVLCDAPSTTTINAAGTG